MGSTTAGKAPPKKPNYERATEKLAERLTKHGNMSSEQAHKVASETCREREKQR